MRLSIGPALFEWGRSGFRDFYRRMAFETAADILYMGEVVCSVRANLTPRELGSLWEELRSSGKEVVFSTLGLVMKESELVRIREIVALARELGVRVEANDMAAVGIGEGAALVAGPHINTYNPQTVALLRRVGVGRVVLPVELGRDMIAGVVGPAAGRDFEVELFAYGKLPLTFSARCYTSRAFHLPKADCQYKCGEFPDGMVMRTQEGTPLLTINGIQTMSDRLFNLAGEVESLRDLGVDILRLSPQSRHMEAVVAVWRARVDGRMDAAEAMARLRELNDGAEFCNGYFFGQAGLDMVDARAIQEQWTS
ncbi:MAG: U32 family peptidase [Magnetococcus sp. WYHC-3]